MILFYKVRQLKIISFIFQLKSIDLMHIYLSFCEKCWVVRILFHRKCTNLIIYVKNCQLIQNVVLSKCIVLWFSTMFLKSFYFSIMFSLHSNTKELNEIFSIWWCLISLLLKYIHKCLKCKFDTWKMYFIIFSFDGFKIILFLFFYVNIHRFYIWVGLAKEPLHLSHGINGSLVS